MKIKLFVLTMMVLCLTSCAGSRVRGELPATDLAVTKLAVNTMTQPRQPEGEIKRVEDATTNGQLFKLSMALEETVWLSNQDKLRIRAFVNSALDLIDKSRRPACKWYQLRCKD